MSKVGYPTDPLDPIKDVQFYVKRVEDEDVRNLVQRGKYVALIGARRTGKTSLSYRLLMQLEHDCIPLYVDIMPFEDKGEKWYRHVAEKMLDQLQGKVEINSIERLKLLNFALDNTGFSRFLEELAKKTKSTDRIIVVMDEVGMVPPEIAGPLFRSLRAAYNSRKYSDFYRYTFVFAGIFEPAHLIKSKSGSIFDVVRKVYTSDTDTDGVHQLVALLDPKVSDRIVRHICSWTDGHLYLTQRLCSILDDQGITKITKDSVDQAVAKLIADDDSIVHIRERLNADESVSSASRKVLVGKRLKWGNTMARKLNLIGLVKRDGEHNCVIRNRILEKVLREYFQEQCLDEGEGKSVSQWMRTLGALLIALLGFLLILWLYPDVSDVFQAKVLKKSNKTPIIGLRDSNGVAVEAAVYSPRLLDPGQPQSVDVAIHSHCSEKPLIEFVSHQGSDIVVTQDNSNPYKATIEWRDTSPSALSIRWVEQRQVDIVATMPITGSQLVETPIFVKTNYLSSFLTSLAGVVVTIVASIVAFGERIQKLKKWLPGRRTERQASSQR